VVEQESEYMPGFENRLMRHGAGGLEALMRMELVAMVNLELDDCRFVEGLGCEVVAVAGNLGVKLTGKAVGHLAVVGLYSSLRMLS
jgi:hypothetical protein